LAKIKVRNRPLGRFFHGVVVVALQQFHSMRRIFQWADKHCALESATLGSGLQGCRADFI
jgi:hypothetical protein